ncbi:MAG: RNA 2',3'-cyclic phosphodiesterase [Propioniciclava sp.]
MRLFIAVDPPEAARADLTRFLEPRWEHADGLRFTRPETWHVTLAFMGACPARVVDDLIDGCATVAADTRPPTLALHGAGAFPDVVSARALYAAVDAPPELPRWPGG